MAAGTVQIQSGRRGRANVVPIIALVILLAGFALQTLAGYSSGSASTVHARGSDDAYISYRYAENLAEGHGLVYNPGERVEGYSNLLYVLLLTPMALIAPGVVYIWSLALNLICVLGAFLLFYRFVESRLDRTRASIAALFFAACPPVWVWTASGLETPLVLVLQIGMWVAIESVVDSEEQRNLVILLLLTVLLMIARADGFITPLAAILYLLLRGKVRAALYSAGTVALTLAAYTLWRYSYYGYPFPNTYYAKVSGPLPERLDHAMTQLRDIALKSGLLAYLLAILFETFDAIKNSLEKRAWPLSKVGFEAVFAVCWLMYWFYIGGDIFDERFLLALYPMGIYALLKVSGQIWVSRPSMLLIGLVMLLQLSPLLTDERFGYSIPKYDAFIELGEFLQRNYAGKTLAIDAAGKAPYFSKLPTIDMLGLNDVHIAHLDVSYFLVGHNKFDPDYVLARKPDLIASWIHCDLHLNVGMPASQYRAAGYNLKYLLNVDKQPVSENIRDVSGLDDTALQIIICSKAVYTGFGYAILEKK